MTTPTIVYLDITSGNNENGIYGNSEAPFKEVDVIYTRIRSNDGVQTTPIKFYCNKGFQKLNLPEYSNCYFNALDGLVFSSQVTLNDVKIEGKIFVEIPVIPKGELLITTRGNTEIMETSILKVLEASPNNKVSYPDLTLIVNQGDLKIDAKADIAVNRKFTFIQNESSLRCIFPDVKSQGGDLFKGTSEAKDTLVLGSATSEVQISRRRNVGYLYTTKTPNEFSLGNFSNGAVFSNVKVTVKVPMIPEMASHSLFKIPVDEVKSSAVLNNLFNYNLHEGLLLHNCELQSEVPLSLCNSENITKINTVLKGISFKREIPHIKKVVNNLVLDDDFADRYHVESTDSPSGVTITIPDEIDIGGKELYFRKLNPQNRLFIKAKKFHGVSNSTLCLDRTRTQVLVYKHEGFFYAKNIY